jgi:hypothetical protein
MRKGCHVRKIYIFKSWGFKGATYALFFYGILVFIIFSIRVVGGRVVFFVSPLTNLQFTFTGIG